MNKNVTNLHTDDDWKGNSGNGNGNNMDNQQQGAMQRRCISIRKMINIIIVVLAISLGTFKATEWFHAGRIAVRERNFEEYSQCILLRETYHTGTGWEIIGDCNGYYIEEKIKDVIIKGNLPSAAHPTAVNSFLCKVNSLGKKINDADGGEYAVYEIVDWNPVYPVVRSRGWLPECIYSKRFLRKDEYETY